MRRLRKVILWGGVYALWAGLVVWFLGGGRALMSGGIRSPEELLRGISLSPETEWYSIYLQNRKIGFARNVLEPRPEGGYVISSVSLMNINMMGVEQRVKMEGKVWTDSLLALLEFEGEIDVPQYTTHFKGRYHKRSLIIEITTGGRQEEKVLPASEPIYLSETIKPLIQRGRLGAGDTLKLFSFDPVGVGMQEVIVIGDDEREYELAPPPGIRVIKKNGDGAEKIKARKLQLFTANIQTTVYVDPQGNSIAEFGPMGLQMWRCSEEEALSEEGGRPDWDLLDLFAIIPQGKIEVPRKILRMAVLIEGVDRSSLGRMSSRQTLVGETLIVGGEYRTDRISRVEIEKFLQPSPYVQSDHPAIYERASEVVKGGQDLLDSLGLLSRWVYQYVHKTPSSGIPSALDVLRERVGDCNEHSVLYVAMARALGVPARIQLGVVYHRGRFYYHAWPACWVGERTKEREEYGRWVEFDPTFGQTRADAARITLATGEMSDAVSIIPLLGRIKIKILEYHTND